MQLIDFPKGNSHITFIDNLDELKTKGKVKRRNPEPEESEYKQEEEEKPNQKQFKGEE